MILKELRDIAYANAIKNVDTDGDIHECQKDSVAAQMATANMEFFAAHSMTNDEYSAYVDAQHIDEDSDIKQYGFTDFAKDGVYIWGGFAAELLKLPFKFFFGGIR